MNRNGDQMEESIMKKTFVVLAMVMAFASCGKEVLPDVPEVEPRFVFNITVNNPGETKAVKSEWESGDKIYVFFEDVTGARYVQLSFDGSEWTPSLQGGLLTSELSASGKHMYAVHFPYEQPVIAWSGTEVTFERNAEDRVHGHYIYTYYLTATAGYTIETEGNVSTLSGTLDMINPDGFVQFFIDKNGSKYNADFTYRLGLAGVHPTACTSLNNGTFGTKQLASCQPMWGYKFGDTGVAFSGVIDNSWSDSANKHRVYLFDINAPAKNGILSGRTLSSHDAVKFKASTISSWDQATEPGTITYEGTKWATFNIGTQTNSSSEEKSGGWYFVWGDLIPARSMYPSGLPVPYFGSTEYYYETAYWDAKGDSLFDLTGEYNIFDAARAFLGPDWRLPSKAEFVAIAENYARSYSITPWWEEDGNNALFVIKDNNNNEEYGFQFPGAGYWYNGTLDRGVGSQDSNPGHYAGYYWFSTLDRPTESVHFFFNHWLGHSVLVTAEINACFGVPIRPVHN